MRIYRYWILTDPDRHVHVAVSVTGAMYITISHYWYDITACQDSGGVVGSWTGIYYSHL